MKRLILGKFSAGRGADARMARAVSYASEVLKNHPVQKAVYNEAVAKGPRGDSFGFDFLVEAWLGQADTAFDSERSIRAARSAGIDPDLSCTVFADEKVVKLGSAAVKATFLSKRRPGTTVDEYLKYWRGRHDEIIQAQKDFFAFVRGYAQNHFVPGSYVSLAGKPMPQEDTFDGAPQMWFDSADDIHLAFATEGYQRRIKADELILVKVGFSQSFIAQEHLISLQRR